MLQLFTYTNPVALALDVDANPKLRQAEAVYSTRKTGQVLGPVQPGCLSRNEDFTSCFLFFGCFDHETCSSTI